METWILAAVGLLSGLVALANKLWRTRAEAQEDKMAQDKKERDEAITSWVHNGTLGGSDNKL